MPTIAECVEPLRTSAMDRAEQFAREYADRLLADLAACGGDAEVFAPYPKNTMGRGAYMAAQLKHGLVQRLTNPVKSGSRSPRDPDFRVPNPAGVAKFVEEARQDADRQYSAFIAKLESKVGPHSDATLQGDHVWGYSVLTVETPGGRQDWKTQQILNVSKLGKVFNQWPTRLVGGAKAAAEVVQAEPVAEPEVDPKMAALAVIALTPHIREYLAANDPKALQQVQDALLGLGGPVGTIPGFPVGGVQVAPPVQEAALIACMPHVCPSCQSAHVAYPDSKGLVECQECGDWFNPLLGAAGGPIVAAKLAPVRLYDATDRTGRPIKVTIPENDNA